MPLKIVVEFQDAAQGGTETYYSSQSDPVAFTNAILNVGGAGGVPYQWLQARRSFLHNAVRIIGVRAGLDTGARYALTANLTPAQGQGLWSIGQGVSYGGVLEDWTSLLCNLYSTTAGVQKKAIYFYGVPNTQISPPQTFAPSAVYLQTLQAFFSLLTNSIWQTKSRPPGAVSPISPIGNFTVSASGRNAAIIPVNPIFTVGANGLVIVRGLKYPRGWNGIHQGLIVAGIAGAPTFCVIGPTRYPQVSIPAWDQNAKGTVQQATALGVSDFQYSTITLCEAVRMVERKRGRPLGVFHGRRSGVA